MKPLEPPDPCCIWCGKFFLNWALVKIHIKGCRKSPRPRAKMNRKRMQPSQGTVEDLFLCKSDDL
jgi:hypothetical protein